MKRRLVATASLVALLAVSLVVFQWTSAGAKTTLRFKIDFPNSAFEEDDSGPVHIHTGDFLFRKGGDPAGHLGFHCIEISESPPRDVCHGIAKIKGKGQISVSGIQAAGEGGSPRLNAAVNGGTGAFKGARGVLKFDFREGTATFILGD